MSAAEPNIRHHDDRIGLVGRPTGLIIMLHGRAQTPQDFAAGTAMTKLGFRHCLGVLNAGQPRGTFAQICRNGCRKMIPMPRETLAVDPERFSLFDLPDGNRPV